MPTDLTLISHTLCPYVQRAAIALNEKGVPFRRVYVDLADKPTWFLKPIFDSGRAISGGFSRQVIDFAGTGLVAATARAAK